MVSTQTKVKQLEGLLGTRDLTDREADFVRRLASRLAAGTLGALTDRQADWLHDLWARHFA